MIELHSSTTPNVLKVVLMLEETGLAYALKPVNVWAGEQFAPDFVALNPNAKIVGEDFTPVGNKDYNPYLSKIAASGAEVVFVSHIGGDGQVTVGETVMKANATKVRRLADGEKVVGKKIGVFLSIEAKRPGRRGELRRGMSAHQEEFMEGVLGAGGLSICCDGYDDLAALEATIRDLTGEKHGK